MKRFLLTTMAFSLSMHFSHAAEMTQAPAPLKAGVHTHLHDSSVRPQDDFFRYSQGLWLKNEEIPADKSDWGTFMKAREDVQTQLKTLVLAAAAETKATGNTQKIGDLYSSFMNQEKLNQLGVQALKAEFAKIDQLSSKQELPALMAFLNGIEVRTPLNFSVGQDRRDALHYIAGVSQSGLSLPSRDYYLKLDDPKMTAIRSSYQAHIAKMFTLAGFKAAETSAQQILVLETELARAQWSNVQNRDPIKTYNKFSVSQLKALTPAYDWDAYFAAINVKDKVTHLVVMQPDYLQAYNQILEKTPVDVWKTYFKWKLLNSFAAYLSTDLVDADFAFKGVILSGTEQNRSREKRAIALVDDVLGEAVGQMYVEKYFDPAIKLRTEAMVKNFLLAFKDSINDLDWMSADTKQQAQIKLSKISVKIAHPDQWRDYSSLQIKPDDLAGNLLRARRFDHARGIAKLGKPIDRKEWHMTPQTVNAYYSPAMNEIVFPAARLQMPLFNVEAEDAVNYGALGISIGHEISHAFDDSGSQYDGDGNLRDWWTAEDRVKFKQKTKVLVEQYNRYSPVPGYFLNGELTLGENIADTAGIVMALKAYKISLGGKPAPVIDGMTAEQRLFLGLAQARRSKARETRSIALVKTDPHSPGEFRVNGSLKNHSGFYQAFDVKPGDKMYLTPEQRVTIW